MRTVNVYEAKSTLSKLLSAVEAGEEIVIARNGRPIARLAPITSRTGPRTFGQLAGRVRISTDFDAWSDQDEQDWYGG